jgi:uncharacterized protein YjbJ (UPF0337 family)
MTVNDIKTDWRKVQPQARQRWGRLTDDDLDEIQGDATRLVERLEARYGFPRQIVLAELGDFLNHGAPN